MELKDMKCLICKKCYGDTVYGLFCSLTDYQVFEDHICSNWEIIN